MSRGWLIVFAKAPRAGLVKTRLSPPLSLDQCVEFYEAMLSDILQASGRFAREADLDPILAFHPPDAATELIRYAPPGFRMHAQRGLGLAERMANAFAEGAAAGAGVVLLRGSDSPGLGFTHIIAALDRLEAGADLVFTPDEGGGYAMIGMRNPHAEVFEAPMSTGDMLEVSISLAEKKGLAVSRTPPSFDLDTAADLAAIDSLSEQESSDLCPRTVQLLSHWRSVGVL